jgi:hypothetical protein
MTKRAAELRRQVKDLRATCDSDPSLQNPVSSRPAESFADLKDALDPVKARNLASVTDPARVGEPAG